MRIAFYAPLKSPDHPVPSGDRLMARLLMRALEKTGHKVELASALRAYANEDSIACQQEIARRGGDEAARLIEAWTGKGARRPDLWFTYHLYYRAPDWIGPAVAEALAIPYVIAEASFAMKRAEGVWKSGHNAVERALGQADAVFLLARDDRAELAKARGFSAPVIDLPPFIDPGPAPAPRRQNTAPRLLAVGMMRARAKVESYRILGRALAALKDLNWHLEIAGDGPARTEVEQALAPLGSGRVSFLGALEPDGLACAYERADLLVWPGYDEAYGMIYLESQAAGLPVVAMNHRGVANVVRDGISGRLTEAGNEACFSAAIRALIEQPGARSALGDKARTFIERDRSLTGAAHILSAALDQLAHAA